MGKIIEEREQPLTSGVVDINEVSKRTVQFVRICAGIAIPLIFVNYFQGLYLSTAFISVYTLILLVVLYFSKRGYLNYTKPAIVICVSLFFGGMTILQGRDSGVYMYFLPLSFSIPFLIDDHKNFKKDK